MQAANEGLYKDKQAWKDKCLGEKKTGWKDEAKLPKKADSMLVKILPLNKIEKKNQRLANTLMKTCTNEVRYRNKTKSLFLFFIFYFFSCLSIYHSKAITPGQVLATYGSDLSLAFKFSDCWRFAVAFRSRPSSCRLLVCGSWVYNWVAGN